jgi:hypothetical protein
MPLAGPGKAAGAFFAGVEKTLIDQLGLHYLHAHQIASRAEQAAVRAASRRCPAALFRAPDRAVGMVFLRDQRVKPP